ncbi:hypothetical protein QE152_g12510 [Popillia japonica]|uniref:Uncharacterized protein n=1 Tax=Popillia japonica TaxID=7064 RepID=A0AAW1LRM4_POPJA
MPTNIIFRTYDKRILPVLGFAQVTVAYRQNEFSSKIDIVNANLDSICGREWVFQASINLVNVNEIEAKDTGSQAIVQITNLASSYEDIVANEIGCLKDVEAELFLEKEEKSNFLKGLCFKDTDGSGNR